MLGKIALEEAWELPEVEQAWKERWGKLFPAQAEERAKQIVDITGQRLALAKKHGVGYQILSHTAPGVQGVSDPKEAEDLATHVNDYIAGAIRGHEHFLGAFAYVSSLPLAWTYLQRSFHTDLLLQGTVYARSYHRSSRAAPLRSAVPFQRRAGE